MLDWRGAFQKTIEVLLKQGFASYVGAFEYELESQNLSPDLRWFPVFLKMQSCPKRILELAEFEYLRAQVYSSDLGLPRLEEGLLGVNPHAQFIEVSESLPELGRGAGLYCLVRTGARFIEIQLSLSQALLLDLLREDRKYSHAQLIAQAEIHPVKLKLSHSDWEATLRSLLDLGIILRGTSAFTQNFA